MSPSIYVASSWSNGYQPAVVAALREAGCEVYDFHDPALAGTASWRDIYTSRHWHPPLIASVLWGVGGDASEIAEENFALNFEALERCDALLLVMPCGRSAHSEFGWAAGRGKRTAVLLPDSMSFEAELMWKLADDVLLSIDEVVEWATTASQT